jgi:hypothetical protein
MIRMFIPDPDLDILPIRDQGSKRHRIPDSDPQHRTRERNIVTNYGEFSFLPMTLLVINLESSPKVLNTKCFK